jgi:hypothetical protein
MTTIYLWSFTWGPGYPRPRSPRVDCCVVFSWRVSGFQNERSFSSWARGSYDLRWKRPRHPTINLHIAYLWATNNDSSVTIGGDSSAQSEATTHSSNTCIGGWKTSRAGGRRRANTAASVTKPPEDDPSPSSSRGRGLCSVRPNAFHTR